MPAGTARHIRVARLRGKSEPVIRRGAVLLEDALQTASLSGTERERLVLIRSLDLGEIRADRSATRIAHQLERHLAELMRHAVHGDDPRAPSARAVFFYDRLDALLSLIVQLSRGAAGDRARAWYWRPAVPGWQPGMSHHQAGRVLLRYLFMFDADGDVLAQAFHHLVDTSSLDVILCAIQEHDGRGLLQRFGRGRSEHALEPATVQVIGSRIIPLPQRWHVVLTRWVTRWGLSDVRSLWLVAWAAQSWHPERAVTHEEATTLLQVIGRTISSALMTSLPEAHSTRQGSSEPGSIVLVDQTKDREELSRLIGEPVYTPHAGFWFVIPLLIRTGFGRAVQDHPEWAERQLPWRLLYSMTDRLLIPPDDPVRVWVSQDTAGDLKNFDGDCHTMALMDCDAEVKAWRILIRRWCRVHVGVGLFNLVRRPGWVSWHRTHLEVRMPMSVIDLRIRRMGVDVDPGWVPWLGRVIRFSYETEGRSYGVSGNAGH